MKRGLKSWVFPVSVAVVVAIGMGLQIVAWLKPVPDGRLEKSLSEMIPNEIPGWRVVDLDLGATESISARSRNLLNLDDYVHRQYQRGGTIFSVYVAYWSPGKMPVRLVNQHTPDRCWTEVGYTCEEREWNVHKSVKGVPLQPGQWGAYKLDDRIQYTYFWHIVGGEAHWYGGERLNTRTSISTIWEDFRKFGLNVYREQLFVRIVSPEPMDELWSDAAFQEIMLDLADLCLAQPDNQPSVALK